MTQSMDAMRTPSPGEAINQAHPATDKALLHVDSLQSGDLWSREFHKSTMLSTPAGKPEDSVGKSKFADGVSLASVTGKPEFTHAAIDMGSSLTAGVGGTVLFSLARSAPLPGLVKAATIPMAMAVGGVLKYASKTGLEHTFLDEKERTASAKDLLWGSVDAVAGIGASSVEKAVASRYFTSIGRDALGSTVVKPLAEHTGELMARESLGYGLKANLLRGATGGTTGAAIWSVPHRSAENWEAIKANPVKGLKTTAAAVMIDTTVGTAFGGSLGLLGTGTVRYKDVIGKTRAAIAPEKNLLQLDTFHINDFHSNTEQLPRLTTVVERLSASSAARGVDHRFVVPGDVESGRVNFAFTEGGRVENEALIKAGAKEFVPGNHAYDAPGGKGDVPRYPAVMEPLLQKHPDVSLLAANLDVSAYPQYQRILKPYTIREVQAPWGKTKVATIGLTTEEGAIGNLKYQDAAQVAERTIKELNAQGVKIINIHSHLGLGEDVKLAQYLIQKDLKVAGIFGGHTHDTLARPLWVGQARTNPQGGLFSRLPFLRSRQSGSYEIPIAQAGDGGKWVGEMNQAITQDGISHRYQTTGRLHQVSKDIPENKEMRQFLTENLSGIEALKSENYGAQAVAPYSVANSRNRETAIGNLMADAIRSGLKARMGDEAPLAVMVHSGGIRASIPAGEPLTRLNVSNIVMNAGNPAGETKELVRVTLTGKQLKDAIEYGIRERATPQTPTVGQRLTALFKDSHSELVDEPGNFVQVSGMKYAFDTTKPGLTPNGNGQRVVDLQIANKDGIFEAVKPDQTYNIVTRFHPVEKWWKYNMFGTGKSIEQVHQEINAQPVKISQVDLIGDYIRGKTLDPTKLGAPEGRIIDRSPVPPEDILRPGKSLATQPIVAARARGDKQDDRQP